MIESSLGSIINENCCSIYNLINVIYKDTYRAMVFIKNGVPVRSFVIKAENAGQKKFLLFPQSYRKKFFIFNVHTGKKSRSLDRKKKKIKTPQNGNKKKMLENI